MYCVIKIVNVLCKKAFKSELKHFIETKCLTEEIKIFKNKMQLRKFSFNVDYVCFQNDFNFKTVKNNYKIDFKKCF